MSYFTEANQVDDEREDVIDVDELKEQLNVTFDDDDVLLERKLNAAILHTEQLCGEIPDPIPHAMRDAILMLAAHLYENREAATAGAPVSVPFGYDSLIVSFRAWAF